MLLSLVLVLQLGYFLFMEARLEVLLKSGEPGPGKGVISGKEIEAIVDEDLKGFEKYFCETLGNSSLADPEKAIVKTWLYWKLVLGGRTEPIE